MGCNCGQKKVVVTSVQAEAQRQAVAEAEAVMRAEEARMALRARLDAEAYERRLIEAMESASER